LLEARDGCVYLAVRAGTLEPLDDVVIAGACGRGGGVRLEGSFGVFSSSEPGVRALVGVYICWSDVDVISSIGG